VSGQKPTPEFAAAVEKAGLLQSEYPDEMARRSCTCEPDAICGAHRLLARYHQLYEAFCEANRQKREARQRLRENAAAVLGGTPSQRVLYRSITDPMPGTENPHVSLIVLKSPPGTRVVVLSDDTEAAG
jgi:hypothetical protein